MERDKTASFLAYSILRWTVFKKFLQVTMILTRNCPLVNSDCVQSIHYFASKNDEIDLFRGDSSGQAIAEDALLVKLGGFFGAGDNYGAAHEVRGEHDLFSFW
jgi:hypothetical protein